MVDLVEVVCPHSLCVTKIIIINNVHPTFRILNTNHMTSSQSDCLKFGYCLLFCALHSTSCFTNRIALVEGINVGY